MSAIPQELTGIPRVPPVPAPTCDLRALPVLWQADVIRGLRPPLTIAAHPLALSLVFKDSGDAFCRGFDLLLSAKVPASREVIEAVEADPEAFERLILDDVAKAFWESEEGKRLRDEDRREEALLLYGDPAAPKPDGIMTTPQSLSRRGLRHRRLFGHPDARVFILGDRLLVLHPGGAS